MSSCAGLEPVARESFTRSKVHCKASNRSVHDQVSKSGWVRGAKCRPTRIHQDFAEFFAELRAEKAPNRPFCSSVLRRNKTSSMLTAV